MKMGVVNSMINVEKIDGVIHIIEGDRFDVFEDDIWVYKNDEKVGYFNRNFVIGITMDK